MACSNPEHPRKSIEAMPGTRSSTREGGPHPFRLGMTPPSNGPEANRNIDLNLYFGEPKIKNVLFIECTVNEIRVLTDPQIAHSIDRHIDVQKRLAWGISVCMWPGFVIRKSF